MQVVPSVKQKTVDCVMNPLRQTWVLFTGRYSREPYRQPAVIFMALLQPIIWLLPFGALSKDVAKIPGFGLGSYITYLTPGGGVIMTAIFGSSPTGTSDIEDMQTAS